VVKSTESARTDVSRTERGPALEAEDPAISRNRGAARPGWDDDVRIPAGEVGLKARKKHAKA
jgi:hypothetical protein